MNARHLVGVLALLALTATVHGTADAYNAGLVDPVSTGSWTWNLRWSGLNGYVYQETGMSVDFTFDRQVILTNSRNPFEAPYADNFVPATWSLDYGNASEVSMSGPDIVGTSESLTRLLHFNNDATPGLAYFDFSVISYNDGVIQEWGDLVGTYNFNTSTWEEYSETYRDPATIPEPATLLILATGLFGYGLAKRRRRA